MEKEARKTQINIEVGKIYIFSTLVASKSQRKRCWMELNMCLEPEAFTGVNRTGVK